MLSRWQTPPEFVSLRGAGSLAIMDPGIRQVPLEVILDNAHSNETPLAPGRAHMEMSKIGVMELLAIAQICM